MGPGGGKRADAIANRQAVIDAALALLPENPDASIQEIADRSGVGRSTVYRHFPNREVLFEEIAAFAMEESRAAVTGIFESEAPAEEALRDICRANIELGHRFRALYVHPELTKPRLRAMSRAEEDPLPAFLERARERGEIRTDQPLSWLRATFLSLNMAMVQDAFMERIDPREAGEVLGETIVAAIVSDG